MNNIFKNIIIKRASIFVVVFLALLGVVSLIVVLNYIFSTNYKLFLSQKTRSDAWTFLEKTYNNEFSQNKNFGEFCYRFRGHELDNNNIPLSIDEQKIRGTVYAEGNIFEANVDPKNMSLEIGQSSWQWKWYNWLGFGINKDSQ
ncbi:MAG: hypothetical protein US83_C0002G0048 [Candidatus Falkowbacteria bacterium GW2011_GWC2_38_22]|uniref:Uncharacterized protein n=1 Tax=Candidatus Falkowbacteria bacterium GW2011_GWE1_38_31 TaxID=1618638 RepID=A0A0G0MAG4_9BACT|nr:MAG: hypothetical protein US73_C0007G0048 [Candidatus Falkowbacteria bacterium GW2011_GWF2_38_1205]KKQ61959.1 MAG: hypothetical protein US83_C0002G0048 [Candidatus Falkowbacteria bacterium GW2011_GWC2_38_22]KKQ63879.1 MAG: hypothetical protein US84_C0003G0069 [Candidatus Falkowbacteria bacterium GW2011_GWF1_38_22]KKQ66136.1 MAG: hypothetical protein US87_C0003G0069 [Candidatus Falkowbacteria bacterium GW2011_GWE2_38_254]KKQ70739.1 MAG: hypothetical protein US91_C0003G0069 [Candidatus Falkowb